MLDMTNQPATQKTSPNLREIIVRFTFSGGISTLGTYLLYVVLASFVYYELAYTIAYGVGIAIAYILNRYFVFKGNKHTRSLALYPLIYLVQYLLGLVILWIWVEILDWNKFVAPLAAIGLTVPITFILNYLFFKQKIDPENED